MSVTFGHVAADVYERNMGRWSRRLAPLLLDFAGHVDGAPHLLDVGCGTGSFTFALAERCPKATITGLDVLKDLIDRARLTNTDPNRIRFDVGNACDLHYESNTFDQTFSSLVLNFIPDAQEAIREMVRVTKPGGMVVATLWDLRGGLPHVHLVLDTAAALDEGAAEYRDRFFSGPGVRPGELVRLWRESHLEDVEESTLTLRMEFPSFADFWEPTEQSGLFGAYIRALSEGPRTLIRDKVRAAYLLGDEDGYRSFTATAWAVKGRVPR